MSAARPDRWAAERQELLQRWARGDVGRWTRAALAVAMPGVPVAAMLGFFANGRLGENTTGWIVGDQAERDEAIARGRKPLGGSPHEGYGAIGSTDLDELGPGGVEGGHRPGLIATDPECAWVVCGRARATVKVLGREGVTGSSWYRAHEDQVVIGVVNVARHAHGAWERLDPRVRWAEDGDRMPKVWDLWSCACAMMAWSAGDGRAVSHLEAYAGELAAVPAAARWGLFCRLAAREDDRGGRHRQDEYSALRTSQKLAAARLATQWCPDEPWAEAWLDDGLGAERDVVMARLAAIS